MENNSSNWKGTHISEFQTSLNLPQFPELVNNDEHAVLVETPVLADKVPGCFPPLLDKTDYWDQNHVKLPCSERNVTEDGINRWNLIREALTSEILSSQMLEAAILSYNKRFAERWNFATLRAFFDEICEEEESSMFFRSLLPQMVSLALALPELITGGVPLLKHGRKYSVTLSQMQIASLLANAFFCTFPHRNSYAKGTEYANYPTINFSRLFQAVFRDRKKATYEKLRCILHYFRRVTSSAPTGVVTYSRNFVSNLLIPSWSESKKILPRLYVSSEGTIENEGFGLFQVDFAHKLIGGGVIGNGCVQEEIRFVICPELILSRLFTECLTDTEALIITGCERFSNYQGYGKSFEWDGDYVDDTPSDNEGRKYCTVIAIDALFLSRNPKEQFSPSKVNRELNKAYAGFSWGSRKNKEELCAIATGNWGCGVYKGNAELKSLLQLMAAAESNRDLAYFTFGNDKLRDSMHVVHDFLVTNNITVGKIYNLLFQYNAKALYNSLSVYDYIRSAALVDIVPEKANENSSNIATKVVEPFGKLKVAETKRSFCFRPKTDDKKDFSMFDSPSTSGNRSNVFEKTDQSKKAVNDADTENLKRQDTEKLLMMYAYRPSNSESIVDEKEDSFDFDEYANKKRANIKHIKRTSDRESDIESQDSNFSDNEGEKIASVNETDETSDSFNFENYRRIKRQCIDSVYSDTSSAARMVPQGDQSPNQKADENANIEDCIDDDIPTHNFDQSTHEESGVTRKIMKTSLTTSTPSTSRSPSLEGLTFSRSKTKKKDISKKKLPKQSNKISNYFSHSPL